MLKKIVLVGLAILIPLGVADAKRNYQRGNQADQTQKFPESVHKCVAITPQDESCWCSMSYCCDDERPWHDGEACYCGYVGRSNINGHAALESKIVAGIPVCPERLPPGMPQPVPVPDTQPKGGGIFKQMKP